MELNVACNFIIAAAFFAAMMFCSNAAGLTFTSAVEDFGCDSLSGGGGGKNGNEMDGLIVFCSETRFSFANFETPFCKKLISLLKNRWSYQHRNYI